MRKADIRGTISFHPKSITDLRSGAKERCSRREAQRSTFARFFGLFDFRLLQRGRAIDPSIVEKMGGLPTTVTLRHRDATYDAATKAGFHKFIAAKLDQPAPSPAEETADPQAADAYYARGVTWLRENTRNSKKFDVLFNENVSYGFRRNLFGLKLPGFLLNALIVLVCLAIFWRRWPVDLSNGFDAKLLAGIVIAILHAAYLALFVTEEGVKRASEPAPLSKIRCEPNMASFSSFLNDGALQISQDRRAEFVLDPQRALRIRMPVPSAQRRTLRCLRHHRRGCPRLWTAFVQSSIALQNLAA